jgi:hypothetical protein
MKTIVLAGLLAASAFQALAAPARIFVEADSGLAAYLPAALERRHVPASITTERLKADYALEANARVIDVRSGALVFAVQAPAKPTPHALRTAADACAKHLAAVLNPHPYGRSAFKATAQRLQIWPSKDPALAF